MSGQIRTDQDMRPIYLVSGANSPVGRALLELLQERAAVVWALTRRSLPASTAPVTWLSASNLSRHYQQHAQGQPVILLAVAPLWSVADTLAACEPVHLQKIVALGSTSEYTKVDSEDPLDRETVALLHRGARDIRQWAEHHRIAWVLLRATLIYGPDDRNLNFWRNFARYSPLLPLVAGGSARRQPIHCEDVARVMLSAATYSGPIREFIIAGPRALSYRQILEAICQQQGMTRRYLSLPVWLLKTAVAVIRLLPGMRALRPAMIERLQQDMVFPIEPARQELEFSPREFDSTVHHSPVNDG